MADPGDRQDQRDQLREERLQNEASDATAEARRRRTIQLGAIGVFAAAAVVVALIVISQSGGDKKDAPTPSAGVSPQVSQEIDGIPQSGTVLGDDKATVTVLEFGDLQCPICGEFSKQESPQLVAMARSGDIKYEFKPWNIIGAQSPAASAAAMAASEQDHFWQFITAFYLNQGEENSGYVTSDFLDSIATAAGIPDKAEWKTDSAVDKWKDTFTANDKEATDLGFTGTPSISVIGPNGRKDFTGNSVPSITDIQSAIDSVK
jgi:protein-disulfide isomerase